MLIRDKDGEVLRRHRTLATIRGRISRESAKEVSINNGKLIITLHNDETFEMEGQFDELRGLVRRWRALYGVMLAVDGKNSGKVFAANPYLN